MELPFASFSMKVGSKLAADGNAIKNKIGSIILTSLQFVKNPVNSQPFPTLDKWQGQGARENAIYTHQVYSEQGVPESSRQTTTEPYGNYKEFSVGNGQELIRAIKSASPGIIISLRPGLYRLSGKSIPIKNAGYGHAPIIVRSPRLGDVVIELSMSEGFTVMAPYWVFENLKIIGTCQKDSYCEHAFHVVGNGKSFVLRNSIIVDFNSPIKVNGVRDKFPDNGLIENSTFYNTRPRETTRPVNLLNINSVNNWRVKGNLLADFYKNRGDRVSYAAYMKGNGNNGIFEQNLVICEMYLQSNATTQVGLSFGGGGTRSGFCRDNSCATEHSNGTIRNNIILNCPTDVGIYLNKSSNTRIYNNSIINSLGIDVRFEASTATILNNIISGRIKDRDGGLSIRDNNLIDIDCSKPGSSYPFNCTFEQWFEAPYQANFSLSNGSTVLSEGKSIKLMDYDFCGNHPNPDKTDIGPIQYSNGKKCSPLYIEQGSKP